VDVSCNRNDVLSINSIPGSLKETLSARTQQTYVDNTIVEQHGRKQGEKGDEICLDNYQLWQQHL